METYQRTYSHTLGQQLQGLDVSANDAFSTPSITIDDYAIACALAGIQEGEQGTAPDTSMDAELALQLHERESARLLRQPSSKARRRSRRLRSLLRHLKPTRVIPRVNPLLAPTASYVSEDRSRLLLRLDMYGLDERPVGGDGNCQFRALADQLYFRESRHAEVRQAVVDQLCCHPERYQDYVTLDYKDYVSSMSKLGTWGDHITLQAAADAFNVGINIITSFLENCVITIAPTADDTRPADAQAAKQQAEQLRQQQDDSAQGPQEEAMQQLQQDPEQAPVPQELQQLPQAFSPLLGEDCITLWLSFWAEVHYNSLAPKALDGSSMDSVSEGSSSEDESTPGKKVLGSSRLGRLFGA